MYYCNLDTPIGSLLLAGDEEGLSLIGFPEGSGRHEPGFNAVIRLGLARSRRRGPRD